MFKSILHRTILLELARVFLLSLLGITGMLLMAGIVAEASQRGLSPLQILAAIPLLIPSTLPYTLPATTLFATCVVYGRLAHDNEILAIKSAGINILSVLWPAIALGIAMTALTAFLYYELIPSTHHMMRSLVLQDIEEFLYNVLRRERCIHHPTLNWTVYVKTVQGHKLIDPVFERKDPRTKAIDVTAMADEAELSVALERNLIIIKMRRCWVYSTLDDTNGFLQEKDLEIPLPADFDKSSRKFRAGDMTWQELFVHRDELEQQKYKIETDLALLLALEKAPGAAATLAPHLANLRYMSQQKRVEIRNLSTEMLMRPAVAIGCLCFVLVGCPVGIWFSKSDYLSAFITCFLPIVFLYYPLLLCGANLSKAGTVNPVLAVWGANALMGVVALPLYRKLLKN